jgi:hypothetical protein
MDFSAETLAGAKSNAKAKANTKGAEGFPTHAQTQPRTVIPDLIRDPAFFRAGPEKPGKSWPENFLAGQ